MANITTEIDALENAVYGEEVRSAIINAIVKINTALERTEVRAVANAYKYKGTVSDTDALPAYGNFPGDAYFVSNIGETYAWGDSGWGSVGAISATGTAYNYRGIVATVAALPESGNNAGDAYYVSGTDETYIWNGEDWDSIGTYDNATILAYLDGKLDDYVKSEDLSLITESEIDAMFT